MEESEAEQRKLQVLTIAKTTVVSPPTQMEEDRADPSINSHLSDMMQGGSEEDTAEDEGEQRSPVKSKQKKITFAEATASKPVLKPALKPLKPAFEAHKHTHPWTIVDASIKSARLHCRPSRATKERSDGGYDICFLPDQSGRNR